MSGCKEVLPLQPAVILRERSDRRISPPEGCFGRHGDLSMTPLLEGARIASMKTYYVYILTGPSRVLYTG
jgi:hypothetical protein